MELAICLDPRATQSVGLFPYLFDRWEVGLECMWAWWAEVARVKMKFCSFYFTSLSKLIYNVGGGKTIK